MSPSINGNQFKMFHQYHELPNVDMKDLYFCYCAHNNVINYNVTLTLLIPGKHLINLRSGLISSLLMSLITLISYKSKQSQTNQS